MNRIKTIAIILALLTCQASFASVIQNGDFSSCDYSGWQKDTDGAGDVSLGNDFEIDVQVTGCRAALNVDYFDTAGDPFGTPISESWFANTLSNGLDFTGNIGSTWVLTIDFEVGSEGTSADPLFVADYFLFGLFDGVGNYYDEAGTKDSFLVDQTSIDGFYRDFLTFELDSSFTNTSDWFFDAQLNVGIDQFSMPDGYGSTLYINEVTLTEIQAPTTDVPEPSTFAIFGLGLIGLINRRKSNRIK
ncbi:MAG: PEP-CTERM sorting domain-containing protein [Colwellia sp.]|nr:PEP-CTERM sorting domain-containing protein [Colwellia sp.]